MKLQWLWRLPCLGFAMAEAICDAWMAKYAVGSRASCCVGACPFTAICSWAAGRDTWSRAIEAMFDLTTYARVLFRTTERLA